MAGPRGRGLVGLDIGTSAVRAAEVSVGSDSATLQRFGQVELPDGAVQNGEIADSLGHDQSSSNSVENRLVGKSGTST